MFEALLQLVKLDFIGFIRTLNSLPVELTWIIFLFFCFGSIIIFLNLFGKSGLYIYTSIAIIVGNIQVLKLVNFSFFMEPIALGTILFASTFLCTDILAEYYGEKSAKKNILVGFSAFLFITILMLFTMGFKPLDIENSGSNFEWALSMQVNLEAIFIPFPIFFGASMIAYILSQYFDVWFFQKISNFTNKKYLWFRNNVSTMISSLFDNIVFSMFAWIIFNPNPLDFNTVLFTFILGTYFLRVFIAIIDTPFIYLAKYFLPKNNE